MSVLCDNSDLVSPASSEDSELRGLSLPFHSYPQDSPGNDLGHSGTLLIPNDFLSPVTNTGMIRLPMRRDPLKEELFTDVTTARYHLDPDEQAQVQPPLPATAVPPKIAESPLPQTTLLRASGIPLIPNLNDFDSPVTSIIRLQMRRDPIKQELFSDVTIARYHFDPDEETQVQPPLPATAVPPKSAESPLPQTTLLRALLTPISNTAPISSTSLMTNASYEIDSNATREYMLACLEQDPQEQPSPASVAFSSSFNGTDSQLSLENELETRELAQAPKQRLRRVINFIYSNALLVFSVWLVIMVILSEKARLAKDSHPFTTTAISWTLLILLATMEGGQGCLIGLQGVEKKNYASTHPLAFQCTTLVHKGDNMERFIIGRQFLVFIVVFLTNMFKVMNAPDIITDHFFLSSQHFWSGAAIMLTTIMLGQIAPQVDAANCMLDFINSRIMLFTTHISLFIENTGILHSAYLVQIVFSKIVGLPIGTKERCTASQKAYFWGRILMSLGLLGSAFAITLSAILQGKTTMWAIIPGPVAAILFFALMLFVGMFEALQIALFEVLHMPEDYFANHKIAKANCDMAFRGKNLQAILIGRQICVTTGVFMIARITTPDYRDGETIFGVSQGVQDFFNTGLLSAFITTIVASLAWRIVAASFPLQFLSNPLTYHTIRLCLLLDYSGICSASKLFALFHKAISGFRLDEVYLGKNDQEKMVDDPLNDVV